MAKYKTTDRKTQAVVRTSRTGKGRGTLRRDTIRSSSIAPGDVKVKVKKEKIENHDEDYCEFQGVVKSTAKKRPKDDDDIIVIDEMTSTTKGHKKKTTNITLTQMFSAVKQDTVSCCMLNFF